MDGFNGSYGACIGMVSKVKAATKAEKQRMATISRMPCIVCYLYFHLETPAMVHHMIDTGRRKGHKFTFPLCHPHHQGGVNNAAFVSRHPHEAEFVKRYGTEDYLLEETNKLIAFY